MRRPLATALLALVLPLSTLVAQAPARQTITLRAMLEQPTYGGYEISPDGRWIMFSRTHRDTTSWESTSHLWLHELRSGRTFQLTSSPRGESSGRFLEDGRIAFTSNRDGKTAWWVISPEGGEATKLFTDDKAPTSGTFTRDLGRVVLTDRIDRADKKEWDEKVKKKDDGFFAERRLEFTHLFTYDVATGKKRQLTSGAHDHSGVSLSPDARWIAYTSNRSGTTARDANWSDNTDIFIVAADSGAERRLTTNPGPDGNPEWSPDGAWIAYTSSDHTNNQANQNDLKIVRVEGGEPRNLTKDLDYSISGIRWSPDGRTLFFTAAEGLTSKLYRVPATGGKPVPVALGEDFVFGGMSMTRDGKRWLITGSSLTEQNLVYLTDADGRQPRRLFPEHESLTRFSTARAEAITWKGADDWTIEGVLTYPVGYERGRRYPMILQVHGGPHGRFSASFNQSAQIWAARGYAVLQGNPRGSSGRTFEFSNANTNDWGGKDFQDLMKGVDHVIALGVADPERLAIMGGSYGGFMTFWAVTQTPRFKAGIGHAGISDWYSFFGQTDIPNLLEFGFGGLPSRSKATYERWSPIEFAEQVTTPLLITHGENDLRVPIAQAEQYYRLLKKLGKTVEFLRYPREGHGITEPRHRLHLDAEQEAWFAKYVLGRGATPVSDGGRRAPASPSP